jgi:hypothetical protein
VVERLLQFIAEPVVLLAVEVFPDQFRQIVGVPVQKLQLFHQRQNDVSAASG